MSTQVWLLNNGGGTLYFGASGGWTISQPVKFDRGIRVDAVHVETGSACTLAPRIYDTSGNLLGTGGGYSITGAGVLALSASVVLAANTTYYVGVYASTEPSVRSADGTTLGKSGSDPITMTAAGYLTSRQADGWATGVRTGSYAVLGVRFTPPNSAPNAPTLTGPANSATLDRGIAQRFAWNFSDPDAGDSQSKYDLQYRTVGGPTWTTVSQSVPNTYRDFAAGTLAAGNYEWQVRTYDAQGVVGPWSASSFFTAADAPAMPTITAPTSGATVSSSETLTWSAPNESDYQWRRVADNAGSADTGTIYQDSATDPNHVADATVRSVPLTFDTNNRYEHIQVRIKLNGLWSSWADIRVLVSFTPPPAPTFTLSEDDEHGSVSVAISNPAPGTGQPALSYNDVYVTDPGKAEERRATNLPANAVWTYRTPPSGFDGVNVGKVRVKAIGTNGTSSST